MNYLDYLVSSHYYGIPLGLPSVCSAHPLVIEAALRHGLEHTQPVLIEATSNQANQFDGYTGMTPADFARFVREIAQQIGFPQQRLILGGDHLGPLPWANEPAEMAMQKAAELVRAAVQAGFTKIHLDCSMPLGDESQPSVELIARRIAFLARIAEETMQALPSPTPVRYVIGSEVPPAGGAQSGHAELQVTTPESAAETLEVTREAFRAEGLDEAWERVRALVVQPDVEFGNDKVHDYNPAVAAPLVRFVEGIPGLVYEAHSTDYQTRESLAALVRDHFAILKVGPALTFALREVFFALEAIERELGLEPASHLRETLESEMLANPLHWQKHYGDDTTAQKLARAYSFSDRIRYYWNTTSVQAALERLMQNLTQRPIPLMLLSQYLPYQYEKVRRKEIENHPRELSLTAVMDVLEEYALACMTKRLGNDPK